MLTGPTQAKLGERERVARQQRSEKEALMKEQMQSQLNSPELLGDEDATRMRESAERQFRAAAEDVAEAKLDVLQESDTDLIDLESAQCSFKSDEDMIRGVIEGNEQKIMRIVVGLIRDVLCGVQDAKTGEPQPYAPGTLALPLNDAVVDLSAKPSFKSSPLYELQFAGWLRLQPKLERLVVCQGQMTERVEKMLDVAVEEGLLPSQPVIEIKKFDNGKTPPPPTEPYSLQTVL